MTYLVDHDVPMDYGRIYLKSKLEKDPKTRKDWTVKDHIPWIQYDKTKFMESLPNRSPEFHALANRTKLAVYVISNCGGSSQRGKYIAELRRHVQIDGYGRCGDKNCRDLDPEGKVDMCNENLVKQYKFFLAFENSICKEYITEKFFKNMERGFVPIVLSGSNHSLLAPPHSYIDVGDFDSPKDLAVYLKFLDDNPAEYLSYFWYLDQYEIVQAESKMCIMCQKLYEDNDEPEHKVYEQFSTYWGMGLCKNKDAHFWSKYKGSYNKEILPKVS